MSWSSRLTGMRRSSPHDSINIASQEFKANPYPFYARLRAETPVCRIALPPYGRPAAWLITRYDDVAAVLKDERFVKNTKNALTPVQAGRLPWFHKFFDSRTRNLLSQDPPDHTRLRALVNKAFTPRIVEGMRERIQRLADDLLNAVQAGGRMDLIHEYAQPLAITIISELVGVPMADRPQFHRWSRPVLGAARSAWALLKAGPSAMLLVRYFRKLIERRRADPQDDLLSALARTEEAGDTLSIDELVNMVMILLVAGYDTTVNLIGSGTLALLEHPDQLEKLRNDPTVIKPAVEELLRYANPLSMATDRYAREAVTIAGVSIPRGARVYAVIGSANRDDRQFPNPDVLDVTREPNKHLAFGLGAHFCVGAPLARLEGQIAIWTLLRRLPGLRLDVAPEALRWRPELLLRGLESLPVAFGPTNRANQ